MLCISVVKCITGPFQSYCEHVSWKYFRNHKQGRNSFNKVNSTVAFFTKQLNKILKIVILGGCIVIVKVSGIPYFFTYRTEGFSPQKNPKNLDPSYKIDLDLWDCLGRVKLVS